jgi:hypothetical protein
VVASNTFTAGNGNQELGLISGGDLALVDPAPVHYEPI